jgi:hypothetical protein
MATPPISPPPTPEPDDQRARVKSRKNSVPLPQYEIAELKEAPTPGFLEISWALAAGLVLGLLAARLRNELQLLPDWVTWIVFPFMVLAERHELNLSPELAKTLPRAILYLQFPLEGLLTMINLRRRVSLGIAMTVLLALHAVGILALWLLNQAY